MIRFFIDLFTVEGAPEDSLLAFAPFLITALALGVILASLYFTVWRVIDARLSRRLYEAGATAASDAKTLAELGYTPGSLGERFLRFLLRSHACVIYKNISCDELDAQRLALMKQEGEVSDPDMPRETPENPSSCDEGCEADVSAVQDTVSAENTQKTPSRRQKKVKPRTRMQIPPETRFYIMPTRMEYVEGHALKVSADEYWGLGFTLAGTLLFWLGALALLDPLVNFLTK